VYFIAFEAFIYELVCYTYGLKKYALIYIVIYYYIVLLFLLCSLILQEFYRLIITL